MPSSARQLLRPSSSFSCAERQQRAAEECRDDEGRTSRSLSSCSYVADLCNSVSRRGLDGLQKDTKRSVMLMVCEKMEGSQYSKFLEKSASNGYDGDSGM